MPSRRNIRRFAPVVMVGIAAVLALWAVGYYFVTTAADSRRTDQVQGDVTEVREGTRTTGSGDSRRTKTEYCPTVGYTVDGKRFSVEGECTTSLVSTLDEQAVYYNPDDPSDAGTVQGGRWFFAGSMALLAVVLGGYGLFQWRKVRPFRTDDGSSFLDGGPVHTGTVVPNEPVPPPLPPQQPHPRPQSAQPRPPSTPDNDPHNQW